MSCFELMMSQLLVDGRWDELLALPEVTDEAKALIEEVQTKRAEFERLEKKLAQNAIEKQLADEYLKHVKQEAEMVAALCKAKDLDIELLNHLTALTERETGRLAQDIARMESDHRALSERRTTLENNIFKAKQKQEKFKNKMQWDQQTFNEYMEEAVRKHADDMDIIKYAQQDDQRIMSLTLAIEKKTVEANEKRKAFEKERVENKSAQIALDKAKENLQQAHLEVQQLVHQFENTIKQVKQRDAEMQQELQVLAQVNREIAEKNDIVTEKRRLLDTQRRNNDEIERAIVSTQNQTVKLRHNLQEEENNCSRLKDELETCKATLDKANCDVKSAASNVSRLKKEHQDNIVRLEQAETYNAGLEEKLKSVTEMVLSEEERAALMDKILKDEEHDIKELDIQLGNCRQELFLSKNHLQTLKAKVKTSIAQISSQKSSIRNLKSEFRKQEQELVKQQMIKTEQEAQVVSLRRKLSRLRGNVESDEKQILEMKFSEVTKELQEKKEAAAMMKAALKKSEDNIRFLRRVKEKSEAQKKDLMEKTEEIVLLNSCSEKELKKLRLKKLDNLLEYNFLKVEVKRSRDRLYNEASRMMTQEQRKLEMQKAIKDREEEIRAHMLMLSQQVKFAEKERRELSAELNNKLSRVKVLKTRYELAQSSLAPSEEEEERSQAYCIIKAVQEKEELRQKLASLDDEIRKTELGNKFLENTIVRFNSSNSKLKASFRRVDKSTPEYQEKVKLEEQLRAAKETLKRKKRQIQELQQDVEDKKSGLESLLQKEQLQKDQLGEKQLILTKLKKEVASQQGKIDRNLKQFSKLTREIRSAKGSSTETFEERDIRLRELKEVNKTVSKMLIEAMQGNPDLRAVLERYFLEAGLCLPSSNPLNHRSIKTISFSVSRSSGASVSSSRRGSAHHGPVLKTVEVGLGLNLTPPPLTTSRCSSSASSSRTLKNP